MAAYSLLDEVWAEPFSNPPPDFTSQQAQPLPQRTQPLSTVENADLLRAEPKSMQVSADLVNRRDNAGTEDLIRRLQQQVKYLENRLAAISDSNGTQTQRQRHMNTNEFLTYIATGAFMIFILDSFLQFGQRLK